MSIPDQLLSASIATPDTDVPAPPSANVCSLTSRLCNLGIGGNVSRCFDIEPQWLCVMSQEITTWNNAVRSSLNSSIRNATERTGHTFSTEITPICMPSGRVYQLAIITRTA